MCRGVREVIKKVFVFQILLNRIEDGGEVEVEVEPEVEQVHF